jgi:hypothetical protein
MQRLAEYIDWFTTAGGTARSGSSHPPSTRTPTTVTILPRHLSERQFTASTELGTGYGAVTAR